jgi:hypothetical protein
MKENEGSFASKSIEPECETKRVPLDLRVPDKTVMISQDITSGEEAELLSFLDKNNDVFAWRTSNLMGVSKVIGHKASQNVRQKGRSSKSRGSLLDAIFMCEVRYPSWLANVVMVKKKNDKWRMCTNFTYLNKCCSKDDFPLVRIDKVVDSAAGYEVMALLDYFLGYHQMWLLKEDEEKTSLITPCVTYCYLRMPESLKNAGPTFYRMTKAIPKEQLERNVFTYIDDLVVASRKKETQLQDLAKTFAYMQKAQLKLHPEKCVFGVSKGKVLGCLVSVKGIEANQDKISANSPH